MQLFMSYRANREKKLWTEISVQFIACHLCRFEHALTLSLFFYYYEPTHSYIVNFGQLSVSSQSS